MLILIIGVLFWWRDRMFSWRTSHIWGDSNNYISTNFDTIYSVCASNKLQLNWSKFISRLLTNDFFKTQKAGPLRDVISFGVKVKFHWWSGFDLFRRLMFFLVYLMFENFMSEYTQVSLSIRIIYITIHANNALQDYGLMYSY